MHRRCSAWTLTLGCLLLVQAAAPLALADGLTGRLETQNEAHLEGTTNVQTHDGVVHIPDGWRLSNTTGMDTIVVNTTWKQGHHLETTPVPGRPPPTVIFDRGHDKHWFNDSSISIEPFREPADVLLTTSASPHANATASGLASATTIHGEQLVHTGVPSDTTQATGEGQRVGFWYRIEGPWPSVQGLDRVQIQGDFTLFVHNVTVTVTSPDGGVWSNWTGYKEDRSPGPSPVSTPQGTAAQFELRVTKLHITNGTLAFEAPDAVNVYAPQLDASVNGTVRGQGASGQLEALSSLFAYDGDPFELNGQGMLRLSPVLGGPSSSDGRSTDAVPGLALEPSGAFSVVETEGVELESVAPSGSADAPGVPGWSWLAGLALLVPLGAIVAVRLARRERDEPGPGASSGPDAGASDAGSKSHAGREHHAGPGGVLIEDPIPEALPEGEGYEDRLQAAKDLYAAYEFREAAHAFQALGHRYPGMATPWCELARVCNELGEHERALAALDRAVEILGPHEPEFLALRAKTHWLAGNTKAAEDAFVKLGHEAPKRAVTVLFSQQMIDLGYRVLDRAPAPMLETWLEKSWHLGQKETAQRVLARLIEADPGLARPYLLEARYEPLVRSLIEELSPNSLENLVREAWFEGRLDLAGRAFFQLTRQAPGRALELASDPIYEPLRDDVRVERILSRVERNREPDT